MFFALFLLHDGCVLHVNTFTTVQNFKGYLFQKIVSTALLNHIRELRMKMGPVSRKL